MEQKLRERFSILCEMFYHMGAQTFGLTPMQIIDIVHKNIMQFARKWVESIPFTNMELCLRNVKTFYYSFIYLFLH